MIVKTKSDKKDVILYFVAKVISGILGFVLISVLTYTFSPELYGEYSLIYGVIGVTISVLIGWISSSSLRYFAKYKDNKEEFYTNVLIQWLSMVVVAIILFVVLSIFPINIKMDEYLLFAIFLFVFSSAFELFTVIARAERETTLFLVVSVGQYLFSIIAVIILNSLTDLGINNIFLSYIISYFIATVIFVVHFRLFRYINFKKISKSFQMKFLKYGLPMVGVWATSWVLNYSDRYIIKAFFDSSEVGIYDVSYKISENSLNIVVTAFTMAIMPILVEKYVNSDFSLVKKTHAKFMNCYYFLMLPAVVGLISIRKLLFGTIIDSSYANGDIVIAIIAFSSFFYGYNQMLFKLWQIREKTSIVLYFNIISVVLNIFLNILLVPKFGVFMAAITTLLSNAIISIALCLMAKRVHKYKTSIRFVFWTVVCCVIMYAASILTQLIPLPKILLLVISIIVCAVVYIIASLLLHGNIRRAIVESRRSGNKTNIKKMLVDIRKTLNL